MKHKFLELKYNQLLKDHKKLAQDTVRCIESNTIMQNLIIDLAHHMDLKDVGKLLPEEIINTAKEKISMIILAS